MDMQRPKWLAYQAKAGIYEIHFEHRPQICRKDLRDFISRAMRWSDCNDEAASDSSHKKRNEYRILDSFFSDSFERSDIVSLLGMAKKNLAPVKFLLANPNSEFAKSRASGIHHPKTQVEPETETRNALKLIFQSMIDTLSIGIPKPLDKYTLNELASSIQTEGKKHNIELRFYDVSTGGPLIFFRDILLVGRYDFGVSSIAMPWNMIVDDVYRKDDIYDLHWGVFDKIWEHAKESIVGKYTICFCYTADQKTAVDSIVIRLAPLHLDVAHSEHLSPSQATWDGNKLSDMVKYSEIVFLCSADAIENPSFCAELGAAWALGKIIHPLLVGGLRPESMSALPISRDATFLKGNNDGLERLISGIQERTKS
jgi:hypothetical protein